MNVIFRWSRWYLDYVYENIWQDTSRRWWDWLFIVILIIDVFASESSINHTVQIDHLLPGWANTLCILKLEPKRTTQIVLTSPIFQIFANPARTFSIYPLLPPVQTLAPPIRNKLASRTSTFSLSRYYLPLWTWRTHSVSLHHLTIFALTSSLIREKLIIGTPTIACVQGDLVGRALTHPVDLHQPILRIAKAISIDRISSWCACTKTINHPLAACAPTASIDKGSSIVAHALT